MHSNFIIIQLISGRYYVQMEFDEAPMEIQIVEPENDPSFIPKVL